MSILQFALLCGCPLPAEIADVPTDDCEEYLDQIQKIGFQRTRNGTTLNEINIALNNPNLLATWTALKAAADSTKVQFTPYINNPTHEASENREFGSGNAVLGGVPKILGNQPTPFSAEFYNISQAIASALRTYRCEEDLSVFLISRNGNIYGLTDDLTTPTTFRGIPILSFNMGDKQLGGYDEPDRNVIRWAFPEDWADFLYGVTPSDFNALLEL